ncbi:hypothetical protein LIER_21940 [Lithospermum erythrorhizon]|uniref:Uncharacterized protein n=1 Tax=Lithospermum erythrorhizon TaxID=34254 RepID=A0AAV3QVG4_LITER
MRRDTIEENDDPIELELEKEFDMKDPKSNTTVVAARPAPTQVSQPVQGIQSHVASANPITKKGKPLKPPNKKRKKTRRP